MAKMTAKEFWGILEEAGFSAGTRDYERILNIVALNCHDNATTAYNAGCKAASEHCARIANKIHDALDARGYYND